VAAKKVMGVGVIGYGFMGRTHTFAHQTIPFYYSPPPVECALRVVCEATDALAEAAKAAGGFERCTTDFKALINADDVDIVHICTPNSEHMPALREAMAAGKHIYVDKPVTGSLAEADELETLQKGFAQTAQVALQYRFLPATLRAKQLVEEGFLGPVTHFRSCYLHSGSVDPKKAVNWKSTAAAGGGAIRDLGVHILDLLWWLIGPFQSACCLSRIWSRERPSLDKPGTTITMDVEEAAALLLKADDGAFGTVEASKIATGTEDELRFEIHGRHGAMRFNLMQPNYLEIYDARLADGELGGARGWQSLACVQKYPAPGNKFPNPKFTLGWIRSHVHALYAFLKAVAEESAPSPSLAEGIHMQRVLEAVRESADKQAWVDLPQQG